MHSGDIRVFVRLPHMARSFRVDTIYTPGPTCPGDANNIRKLYTVYHEIVFFKCQIIAFTIYSRSRNLKKIIKGPSNYR